MASSHSATPPGSLSTARKPLPSSLRTPEQMTWIQDRFKPDGLERLSRADRDYCDAHGNYLPDVAALAHAALAEIEGLTAELVRQQELWSLQSRIITALAAEVHDDVRARVLAPIREAHRG